ncbi:MAG TPA: DUF4197 domain-containing protein [Chitinophagaceae bacterium]|nr:DUF4197 domain-containing protein [Chitinophagaceae bacterium]
MKKVLVTGLLFSVTVCAISQDSAKKKTSLFGKVSSAVSSVKSGKGSSLSNEDIVSGLKEALSVGAKKSADKLSAADGFFKDAAVKVLMPPEAQKVEKALRSIGAGKLVDDAILSFNRAAEDASKSAAPIFVDAVKNMSIQDALGILKGADTSATSYLKKATTTNLTIAFKPTIDASLAKVNATKYWSLVIDKYNSLPTTFNKVNSDLSSYVTEKALSGIFFYVADEEKKIRSNPAARVSDILKKVFGN